MIYLIVKESGKMKQYSSVVARDLSFTYAKRYIEDNKGYTHRGIRYEFLCKIVRKRKNR